MCPTYVLLALLSLASGQSVSPFSRMIVPDGSTLYNEILLTAAAKSRTYSLSNQHNNSNNNNHNHNNSYNNRSTTSMATTEDLAKVLRHFEQFYNVSHFIKKMNQLTSLEDEYIRTQLTTQIDTHLLNRTMFTTNHFPECVTQLKNRSRGIVDRANVALKQCQSLFSEEDEAVEGVKVKLLTKDEYEKFRECAINRSSPVGGEASSLVVDCVNFTISDREEPQMPMRISRCWREILEGAGEIERLLRLIFAQTDNCIAQVRMRQELHGQQRAQREVPEDASEQTNAAGVPNRQRRWRTVT